VFIISLITFHRFTKLSFTFFGLDGYYDLDAIILSLSFLYLTRIKNPEQTKHYSPGDFGKLLGLDRIPEAKTLRKKIWEISCQNKSMSWNRDLEKCG